MSNLSLYEVAHEFRALVDHLTNEQSDETAIADTIEAERYPLELKAQNVAYAIKNLEATAAAIKQAEADMAERRKGIEKRAEKLKEYVLKCMQVAEVTKIECMHFALSIKKNPASVDVFQSELLPAEFMRQPDPPPPAPDKSAIKEALRSGKDVPGATLKHGVRLDIK